MTMSGRPYSQLGITDLEKLVSENLDARSIQEAVLRELQHRNTQRAERLRQRLEHNFGTSDVRPNPPPSPRFFLRESPGGEAPIYPMRTVLPGSARAAATPAPARQSLTALPIQSTGGNAAQNILRVWTVLEVLSPATFRMPADLAGNDVRRVARFDRGLPWQDGPAKGPPGTRLYFQIVLGSVVMKPAMDQLLHRFADKRPERPQARGETPLAIVIVDREGRPVPDGCAVVSSFGWGFPKALKDDPTSLGQWRHEEEQVQSALHDRLWREGRDGKAVPLTVADISAAHDWLVERFGIDRAVVKPPSFAIRSVVSFKSSDPPEPILLNSFYLKDLARADTLMGGRDAPEILKRYLGILPPTSRRDLLNDSEAVEAVVAPARFPPSRWPGAGRHPLVLMQQAAVNLAAAQEEGEILAVNGPPGTGKTTLLRDVVAALVTQRAEAMMAFPDPQDAFTASGERLKAGAGWIHLYKLDPSLKGYEMLIASSNNKAVENVSAELPAIGAIAEDAEDLRYFEPLADTLLGQKAWGAIAAVLGNASNRSTFKERFWWDKDTGLFNYLKIVCGTNVEIDTEDGKTRPPRIVVDLDPPVGHGEALRCWNRARERFETLRKRVAAQREAVEHFRRRCLHLPGLEQAFVAYREHGAFRPGLLQRLFRLRRYRDWEAEHLPLSARLAERAKAAAAAGALPKAAAALFGRSPWLGFGADGKAARIDQILGPELARLREERVTRSCTVVDPDFFAEGREHVQPSAPWYTKEEHRERDVLFVAALDLHRAFIDAAAKPLRHNLNAALQIIDGKGFPDTKKDELIPDLWSSLFLVVPAMSTTFASVGTMLGRVPPQSLGWLLVDEAGQAPPQQAVGALMRVKRAIVVGDPVQVEPVVLLPEDLTTAICKIFGVDAQRFGAPAASVQTLADEATAWFAEFPARVGSRTAGVPLLVHRRCADPMFSIANRVAYEGLMVQAKRPGASPIRDRLGPARWLHVEGSDQDKWCEAEGRAAVEMLEDMVGAGIAPDLYLVTPFVMVADGLRCMIRESMVLRSALPEIDSWVRNRVGTIHTVQGREAEAVIFVLGAPNADQTGARGWAGKTPNLLNVAVTRAKEVVYVIGNRSLWQSAGVFSDLDTQLARWEAR
ncbi:Part of AAA domain-containing protein [Sphingobium faniae]|nr:Part of AAA domain-containing protein [Sphingobium faniae]